MYKCTIKMCIAISPPLLLLQMTSIFCKCKNYTQNIHSYIFPATLLNSIPARAPDLHSSVTCHVYGSPLVFSDSASSGVGGNALAHKPNILGRK